MGSWSSLARRIIAGALVATLVSTGFAAPSFARAAVPAGVAGTFADTWLAFGADTLGAPVTPPIEVDGRLTQFFAFGALVATDGGAERFAVGSALAEASHRPDRLTQGRRAGLSAASAAFSIQAGAPFQPSLAIGDGFERLGGAERFGRAISRPATVAGQQVQWFEYGRVIWSDRITAGTVAFDGWELARLLGLPVARSVASVTHDLPTTIDDQAEPGTGFAPARIAIPAIGVDASIESIGIINGVMQTPENAWNVGWYRETGLAGGSGNAVFAAHRDWWGVGPVVFSRLSELTYGDTITVTGPDGKQATYLVTEAYSVPAGANFTPVISSGGGDTITLITCAGNWDGSEYSDRLIVRGVLS